MEVMVVAGLLNPIGLLVGMYNYSVNTIVNAREVGRPSSPPPASRSGFLISQWAGSIPTCASSVVIGAKTRQRDKTWVRCCAFVFAFLPERELGAERMRRRCVTGLFPICGRAKEGVGSLQILSVSMFFALTLTAGRA